MNLSTVYFSPTYTTQGIVRLIAGDLSAECTEYDITNSFEATRSFAEDDTVIIGIPVYSGRVPMIAREKLLSMSGNNTPTVLVATYGNRAYDDALLELKTMMESMGFTVIAAAAFVTEHSVVRKFGAGRPDSKDIDVIHEFAGKVKSKLGSADCHQEITVKGNKDYREYKSIPFKPHAKSSCTACGLCAKSCPAEAIPLDNPKMTDNEKCITCVRCIRICPNSARDFSPLQKFLAEKGLKKLCAGYKTPEIFI